MKNITNKVKEEFHQNGISGVLGKAWHKTRGFLFYSTCSVWYQRLLHEPVSDFTPALELETDFLVQDKSVICEWLENHKTAYPWIFFEKEIDCAKANNHIFFVIKHRNRYIGYVKVGVGPTYIHDFDKTVRFEPGAAFVYDTFILPEYRGMHLALFSINEIVRHFSGQDFNRILCHIEKWNVPSIKTFEKAGFQALGSIRFIRMAWFSFFLRNGHAPFLNLGKYLCRHSMLMERRSLLKALGIIGVGLSMPLNVFFARKGNRCLAQVRAAETLQVRSRVVQIHWRSVCDWQYRGGDYTESIDGKGVKEMLNAGLIHLTGAESAVSAWDQIIRPYTKGDRIVIKPNLNNTKIGYSKAIMTSPQVTQAVVESLLEAGYPAQDITIFDLTAKEDQSATRALSNLGVSSVFLKERDSFLEKVLRKLRIGLDAPDIQAPIKMQKPVRDSAGTNVQCYIPKVLSGTRHLINVPVLKAHQFVLQSSALKNHFGTVRFSNLNSYPVVLHGPDIDWHIADINANLHVRNKTRLIIVDALLGAGCFFRGDHGRAPSEWRTLPEGRTPASLFFSKDPVAVESVLADLIIREQVTMGYEPHSHRYLHVAAQLGLGTHEHADESGSYTNIEFTKVTL